MDETSGAKRELRVQFGLVGESAEKLLRIVAQENGNSLSAVARRIFSVGLRHEPDPVQPEREA